jgi:hypothetical protein
MARSQTGPVNRYVEVRQSRPKTHPRSGWGWE